MERQNRIGHFVSEETRRKISKAHISISEKEEIEIVKLYESGLTAAEVETEFNIGRSVIYRCLKRNNVRRKLPGHGKGRAAWNKGMKLSEEQKARLNMDGLKLGRAWNKGKIGVYSEEYIQKLSESHKGKTGIKSSNWKGGLSFEPYLPEFNGSLKYTIRDRDNFTCQKCRKKENGRAHDCHHINYDKKDNRPGNLIALCISCHMKTNGNRDYWIKYFQELSKSKFKEN